MRTLAALTLMLTAATAADWTMNSFVKRDMGWADVPVGTSVETSTTNDFAGQKMVVKKIETLLRKTRDELVLRVEENGATRERTIRLNEEHSVEASSKVEQLTVGNQTFPCAMQRVRRKNEVITAWVHPKHGVLKMETDGIVMQVTNLDVSRTVGDKT